MDPERWKQISKVYHSALKLESDQREAFLEEGCGGDESLLKEVESLLACDGRAEQFIENPAMDLAAQVMARDRGNTNSESRIGQSLAHYRILEKIGEGGMGVVYRAKDTRLDRQVAIKALPDVFAADPDRLARFEREAKILATLNHPNIAAIHGLEESDGKRFLVLELVEGKTLAERLKKGRIPLDETLEICHQIAVGLEAAHEKGIIHRDLKPSNIKLTPEGKVKILDFGLARVFLNQHSEPDPVQSSGEAESMTRPGVVLGTATYMSPEQANAKPVDKRTDIWAFGCLLYECLTGAPPFGGETVTEILAAVIREEPNWDALPPMTPRIIRRLIRALPAKECT